MTAYTQLPPRLQLTEELEIGTVHVVTGGGAGQLFSGVGVFDSQRMRSLRHDGVMTSCANIYGVTFE